MWGHVDEATAFVVDDYPYGFSLRTKIRYWIETSAKHGDRLVSQTLNPKVAGEHWNKPKKSTYSLVGVMYRDAPLVDDHITWEGLSVYSDLEEIETFMEKVDGHLSEAQRAQMAKLIAARRAMLGVKIVIHEGEYTPEEKVEQAEIKTWLGRRWAVETVEAKRELEAIADGVVR